MRRMKWTRRALSCLAVIILGLAGSGQDKKPQTDAERMDQAFDFWNRLDQPGYAVLVVKDGQVAYQKTFGLACLEHNVPLASKSIFNVATAAQAITGMAVGMLEVQGQWASSDDIRKYIPEIPDFGTPVTIDHLVHHSSGLRDWQAVSRLAGWDTAEITIDRILKTVRAQKQLAFVPGSRTAYSATNYDLLAEAARRATGQTFPDWCWENIFKPLKMTRTQFRENFRAMIEDQAFSYNYPRTAYFKGADNLSVVGSHSLLTSLEDLGKWMLNLETGQVGGKNLIRKILAPGKLSTGETSGFAYGFSVGAYKGFDQLAVVGDWAGYGVALVYYPGQKTGFAVLSNWDYSYPEQFVQPIADIYLRPFLKPEKKAPAPKPSAAKPQREVKLSPSVLGRYAGVYRMGQRALLTIMLVGNGLVLTVPGQGEKYALTAVSETEFRLSFPGFGITFQKDKEGKVHQLVFRQGESETTAPRVELVSPTPSELEEYAGTYANEELAVRCTAAVKGRRIVLTPQGRTEVALSPQEKDRFQGNSQVFPAVIFLRDKQDRVSGFVIDDEPVRGLVFKKI